MGLFSKTCAKTHLPVLYQGWRKEAARLTDIMVLLPGEDPYPAVYDGYGMHLDNYDKAKFVLASDYAGERYDELGDSHYEPNQGYFHDAALIAVLAASAGFDSYEAYDTLLDDYSAGATKAAELLLNELGWYFDTDKSYKGQLVMQAALEGQEARAMEYASQCPTFNGASFETLRKDAVEFDRRYEEQLSALARELCDKHCKRPAPGA